MLKKKESQMMPFSGRLQEIPKAFRLTWFFMIPQHFASLVLTSFALGRVYSTFFILLPSFLWAWRFEWKSFKVKSWKFAFDFSFCRNRLWLKEMVTWPSPLWRTCTSRKVVPRTVTGCSHSGISAVDGWKSSWCPEILLIQDFSHQQ